MMNRRILIAEDDKDIVELLRLYLENEGYEVIAAKNGLEALEQIKEKQVDLALVDIMMPQMNGYELIKEMRKTHRIPMIILSAKDADSDKIIGLNIGADDYVAKPFNPLEILARINSNLRCFYELGGEESNPIKLIQDNLCLDLEEMTLERDGEPLSLTPTEFKILAKLMKSPGRVFTRAQLYESINGICFESDENTMMVHISKLREKIEEDPKNPEYIKTVRGLGYKFEKKA